MQIQIQRVYMGASTFHDKRSIPKYPKCINCGQMWKDVGSIGNIKKKELVFYGSVNDSKSKLLWEFEIVVEFDVDKSSETTFESDEIEVNTFMKNAYDMAKEAFSNYTTKDTLLVTYGLCDVVDFGVTPSLF